MWLVLRRISGAELPAGDRCFARYEQPEIRFPGDFSERIHGTSRRWTVIHSRHASIVVDRSAGGKKEKLRLLRALLFIRFTEIASVRFSIGLGKIIWSRIPRARFDPH